MSAVRDTLRQAIADIVAAAITRVDDDPYPSHPHTAFADAVLAAVDADPVVRRAFAIAHAVDNEPKMSWRDAPPRCAHQRVWAEAYNEAITKLRAAGKTT